MMEAGMVISTDMRPILVHVPVGRSSGYLPDSRSLWDFLWKERDRILGFAHTHPGSGLPGPSHTDLTTFAAIEMGLGKRLWWWIASSDKMVLVRKPALDAEYECIEISCDLEPPWSSSLRKISNEETPAACLGCGKEQQS